MKVVGDALRAVLCARPDFRLLGMDFSGIESCVLAALTGERWKVEQWKKFFCTRDPRDDPYFIIGKWLGFADDIARDYGKVADLAFGYGGSIGAWRRFAPADDTTSDEQIKKYRDIWRQRHPATRQYLKGLDKAVLTTVQSRVALPFGRLTIHCQSVAGHNWLYIRLPSGRSIPYPFAEIKHYADKDGKLKVGVAFMDYQNKKWQPYKSPTAHPVIWPGLLIENVTQGIARDLLAATLVRLWKATYPPSLHVHDEVVVEVPINSEHSLEEYKDLCERRPDWAVEMDIPVFAKVWERKRWAEGVDIPVTHTPGAVITSDQLVKLHKNKKPKPAKPIARTKAKRPPPPAAREVEPAREARCSSHQLTASVEMTASTIAASAIETVPIPFESDDIPKIVKGNGRPAPEPEEACRPITPEAAAGQPPPGSTPNGSFFDLVDIDGELVFAGTITAEWAGQPRCLPAALAYAAKNWRVFPAPPGTKKSYKSARYSGGSNWGASQDPATLRHDFTKWPDANVAIPTGADNGIFVVETDTKAGGHREDGAASLQALINQHGPLPKTLQAVSPSGSDHFYFEYPEGQTIRNSASKLAPGIDVRGEGGMVIVPPGARDGVGAYRWISNIAPAKAPAWLLRRLAELEGSGDGGGKREPNANLMGPIEMIEAALAVIPNEDAPWESPEGISWNRVGMAVYAASSGSDEGEILFDKWSRKSEAKYNGENTARKWRAYHSSPPNQIGFGSLVHWADEADPSWRDRITKPKPEQPPTWTPTELIISLSASDIPHRRWVYGTYLMRGEITLVVAPGGVGKTALITGMATEIAAGTELLDEKIWGSSLKVLFINGEDGTAEIKRRMWAFRRAHADRISEQTLDRLYVVGADDPRVQRLSFLRTTEKNASLLDHNGFAVLESALDALRPDVLMLDPLVAFCGGGNMNDNAVMAQVMRELKRLAAKFGCAILIVHHTKKGGERGDAETVSGASSTVNLPRRVLMPVPMTMEEAPRLEVLPSERFRYFKLVDAKTNFTPRTADSPWYELHSIELPNPEPPIYPHGDNVQAITRIVFPLAKTASEATNDQKIQRAILDLVDRGKSIDGERHPYSPNITGARNMRALLDDAVVAVADATTPRQWPPDDLRAVALAAINKMKADGWLYEKEIDKGRFRDRSALYVEWRSTPWPNPASPVKDGTAAEEEPAIGDEVPEDGARPG
jgi:Bifunctional DNA primase/polymerase, N-terminal/AAA domain/Primase C terminal 2 (PriCT-2)